MSAATGVAHRLHRRAAWARPASVRVGLVLCATVLAIAFVGPLVSPHGPSELVTRAYAPAGDSGLLLGSESLGRDVVSRVMWGGRMLIVLSFVATIAAYLVGATIGLTAAVVRGRAGELAMRSMDVLLVFPGLLLLLVLLTGFGESLGAIFLGTVLLQFAPVARIVHAAASEVSVRGFVEAAAARGERLPYVLFKEILPNIASPIAADFGPRLIGSVFLIAALGFLGFGVDPPTANWATMVSENRNGISINALAVFAPVVVIAMLTIGIALVSDGIARSIGRSHDEADA